MDDTLIKLADLARDDVPADLRAETYFDFKAHPFEHQALLEKTDSVYGAILGIRDYAVAWLADTIGAKRSSARVFRDESPGPCHCIGQFEVILEEGAVFEPARLIGAGEDGEIHTVYVAAGAKVIGSDLYLDKGSVYVGEGTTIEPCAGIKGPVITGRNTEIRQGAYLRGDCIIGDEAVIRGEIKNSVLMDKASFPHPSYQGDSLLGYMTHFGAGAVTANIGIFAGLVDSDRRSPLVVRCEDKSYDLGRPKMGMCMGDYSQVGCQSASDPGTFLKPYTIAYSLCRISKGFYGPYEILANKPLDAGVIERSAFDPERFEKLCRRFA